MALPASWASPIGTDPSGAGDDLSGGVNTRCGSWDWLSITGRGRRPFEIGGSRGGAKRGSASPSPRLTGFMGGTSVWTLGFVATFMSRPNEDSGPRMWDHSVRSLASARVEEQEAYQAEVPIAPLEIAVKNEESPVTATKVSPPASRNRDLGYHVAGARGAGGLGSLPAWPICSGTLPS